MIKGIQKHVVIVKSPDPEIFEEAIFVVRESYMKNARGSQREVLKQAEMTAERYLSDNLNKKRNEKRARPRGIIAK